MKFKIHHEHIFDMCNQSIPKRIGAYIITHTIDNIHAERYVGVATKNIYNRICGHFNKDIIYIDLYITDDVELAESLERVLMELVRPTTNKIISPLSDKDKEIMKEILYDDNLKEHILCNTIKIGCRYLKCCINERFINGFRTTKTLRIDDKTHEMIIEKINQLEEQYGLHVTIESVVISVLRNGISNYNIEKKI